MEEFLLAVDRRCWNISKKEGGVGFTSGKRGGKGDCGR